MSTFHDRYEPARGWELRLIDALRDRGWLAAQFGQAQIPDEMRPHLAKWSDDYGRATLLRWTPDIIAVRPTATPYACLIDAKTESSKHEGGPNYSIEVSAVDAGSAIVREWNMPLFYAWPDGGVMTPDIVLNRWCKKLDGAGTSGSGTAFYVVAKRWAKNAADMFPDARQTVA